MGFSIREVKTKADQTAFLDVARLLYANDDAWVCPLDMEINAVFDPRKNVSFQQGEAARWLLTDGNGKLCGRIAAYVHKEKAYRYEQPTGGVGFFECVNDQAAANMLFDTARAWLAGRGMQAMDGPINFGENDRYTGLLVQGFVQPGYGMHYNPPYYETLFANYGFETYFEQVTRHLDISQPMPERFQKVAQWIFKKPGVTFEMVSRKNILKYVMDFREIYNDAWRHHIHFTPITEEAARKLAAEFKVILLPYFTCFAYVEGEPAAFVFCLPDLNQIFKPLRGKFSLWQKLLFVLRGLNEFEYYRKHGILTRGRVTIIGTKPKFQRYGLEVGVTMYPMEAARNAGFKEIELGWVGDFNPLSRSLQEATGSALGKVHRVYRYMFDRTKPVTRMESLLQRRLEDAQKATPNP
jgi:hypothetical protein